MEAEFDKQIETILRDLAKGKNLTESMHISHLDADELSAYSENVLPNPARLRVTEHLAECLNCREILSTLVLLNTEAESEIIHDSAASFVSIPPIPWYRKFLAVPNLAYTMGALVLLLVGSVSFLVYQNSKDEATVAQLEKNTEKVKGPSGASSDGDQDYSETDNSNSVTASNTAAPAANSSANVIAAANRPPLVSENSPTAPLPTPIANTAAPTTVGRVEEKVGLEDSRSKISTNEVAGFDEENGGETRDKSAGAAKPVPVLSQNSPVDDATVRQQSAEQNVQNNRAPENMIMPDGQTRTIQAPMPKRSAPAGPRRDESKLPSSEIVANKEKKDSESDSKTVSGKTFRSIGGVWTDSAYQGGTTKSVKRGSDDYKKLDSGLQNIGNSLSGTVIVVWSGKNFKIQ